jgi:hypothetical protein
MTPEFRAWFKRVTDRHLNPKTGVYDWNGLEDDVWELLDANVDLLKCDLKKAEARVAELERENTTLRGALIKTPSELHKVSDAVKEMGFTGLNPSPPADGETR